MSTSFRRQKRTCVFVGQEVFVELNIFATRKKSFLRVDKVVVLQKQKQKLESNQRPILIARQKQKQKRVLTGSTQVFVFVSAKPRPHRLSKMNFFGSQKCLARQKLLVRQKCRCIFVDENSSTKMHLRVPSMQTTSLDRLCLFCAACCRPRCNKRSPVSHQAIKQPHGACIRKKEFFRALFQQRQEAINIK